MLSTVQTDNTSGLYKKATAILLQELSHSSALGLDSITRLVRNSLLFSKVSARFSMLLFDLKVVDFLQLPFMNVARVSQFQNYHKNAAGIKLKNFSPLQLEITNGLS